MSATPSKTHLAAASASEYKTPKKQKTTTRRPKSASLKSIENLTNSDESSAAEIEEQTRTRRSARKPSPTKKYQDYRAKVDEQRVVVNYVECTDEDESQTETEQDHAAEIGIGAAKPSTRDLQLIQSDYNVAGASLFGFNTPKKRDAMALAALNATPCTPKTPKTPRLGVKTPDTKRKKTDQPKTPAHVRTRVKQRKCHSIKAATNILNTTLSTLLQR